MMWVMPQNEQEPRCVFCKIIDGSEPATVFKRWPDAMAIVPLKPLTEGHLLVIPVAHVADYRVDPAASALTMARAAELAAEVFGDGASNLITSAGAAATQTVFHMHLHLVPRFFDDGVRLPWHRGTVKRPFRRRNRDS